MQSLASSLTSFIRNHIVPLELEKVGNQDELKLEIQNMIAENQRNVRMALGIQSPVRDEDGNGEISPLEVESRIVSVEGSPEQGLQEVKEVESKYEHSRIGGDDTDRCVDGASILDNHSNMKKSDTDPVSPMNYNSPDEAQYSSDLVPSSTAQFKNPLSDNAENVDESKNGHFNENRDENNEESLLTYRKNSTDKLTKFTYILEEKFTEKKKKVLKKIAKLKFLENHNLRKAQRMRIQMLLSKAILAMAQNVAKKRNLVLRLAYRME